MKLENQFKYAQERYYDEALIESNIKIAEKFAKDFLSWTNRYKYFALKTNEELLEIYKKENNL